MRTLATSIFLILTMTILAVPGLGTRAFAAAHPVGLQLAAYRSTQALEQGRELLVRQHSDLLGNVPFTQMRVDLGPEKGVFHRLVAGPFASRDQALALMAKLATQGLASRLLTLPDENEPDPASVPDRLARHVAPRPMQPGPKNTAALHESNSRMKWFTVQEAPEVREEEDPKALKLETGNRSVTAKKPVSESVTTELTLQHRLDQPDDPIKEVKTGISWDLGGMTLKPSVSAQSDGEMSSFVGVGIPF